MAGEYVRWLARNEKPREKRELTPEEKRRNWWDYHKWQVIIAVVCAVLLGDFGYDTVQSRRNRPDYVVAYVGQTALPEALVLAAEEGLAWLGEDLNGNGEVRVELRQFLIAEETAADLVLEDAQLGYAGSLMLQSSIEGVESVIFLLEDPERFHATYPILCRADGTPAEADSRVPLWYAWDECPALTGLELAQIELDGVQWDSQRALAGLAVARRGLWGDIADERIPAAVELWERMTAGAE